MSPLTRGELAAMLAALMLTLGVPREVTAYRAETRTRTGAN